METAGYSGTPLFKKMGLKPGFHVLFVNEPDDFRELLGDEVEELNFTDASVSDLDVVVLFVTRRGDLERQFLPLASRLKKDGALWVSWPKKASKMPTDLTEDDLRDVCLPTGWVDVKVCAVDQNWSGLKFVLRRELR